MIIARLCGPDHVKSGGIFKYVRMQDDSFRFSDIETMPDHWLMIDRALGEIAVSAGTIQVGRDGVSMTSYGSMTLKITRPLDDDLARIEDLLR